MCLVTPPARRGPIRVGLDIGGTKTDAVAIDAHGTVLERLRRPTLTGAEAVVSGAVESVDALRARLGLARAELASIGIGVPGVVDAESGRVTYAVNLAVEALDLARLVSAELGIPVRVENDVKAAALGAASLREEDAAMAFLNLGTGVAAGIVVRGELWRGARGGAGEVGHISVDPAGPVCSCGQRGCIESLSGGGALARAWARGGMLPVRDIFDSADVGDAEALVLRGRLARGAAAAIRVLILTADVETVVIGGGLSALGDRLRDDIRAVLREDAATSPFLGSLRLDERIEMLAPGSPVAALGAALVGAAGTGADHQEILKESVLHG